VHDAVADQRFGKAGNRKIDPGGLQPPGLDEKTVKYASSESLESQPLGTFAERTGRETIRGGQVNHNRSAP
jgi:hypothetical protein